MKKAFIFLICIMALCTSVPSLAKINNTLASANAKKITRSVKLNTYGFPLYDLSYTFSGQDLNINFVYATDYTNYVYVPGDITIEFTGTITFQGLAPMSFGGSNSNGNMQFHNGVAHYNFGLTITDFQVTAVRVLQNPDWYTPLYFQYGIPNP